MHIKTLQLKNFRRFEDAAFEFGPGFNLLVGENGSGKSSVLDGIIQIFSDYYGLVATTPDPSQKFLDESIRIQSTVNKNSFRLEKQFPAYCFGKFSFQGNDIYGEIGYSDRQHTNHKLEEMRNLWQTLSNAIMSDPTFTSPVFLMLNAKRGWHKSEHETNLRGAISAITSRRDAYFEWNNPAVSASSLEAWFFQKTVERFDHDIPLNDQDYADDLFLVNNALSSFLDESRNLRYMQTHNTLTIEWKDKSYIPFNTLSDGQRGLIAMVADIARRACLLNPHLDDKVLEETPGIVLIDELDLHLHPKWQRSIVKNLKKTFPKIQFIATTHSPQIIGECKTDEVDRVIRVTEAGGELVHNAFGKDSSAVLRSVMGAEDRDPVIAGLLDQLFTQIDAHDFDQAKATLAILRTEQAGHLYEIGEAEFALRQVENIHDEAAE